MGDGLKMSDFGWGELVDDLGHDLGGQKILLNWHPDLQVFLLTYFIRKSSERVASLGFVDCCEKSAETYSKNVNRKLTTIDETK